MMRPLIILSFFFSGAVHAFTVSSSGRFLGRFPLQAAPPTPIEVAQSTSLTTAETPSGLDERIYKLNKIIIDSVKGAIDVLYANNDYARFYVLETVDNTSSTHHQELKISLIQTSSQTFHHFLP